MNDLMIFRNKEFGEIRSLEINNEPYVCLSDVCKILEIGNVSQLKTRLNQVGVISNEVGVQTGTKKDGTPAMQNINMTFINESNLYKVIFQSRKPEAEKFTEWVTSEVLPSIRKTGGYIAGEENMNEDELIFKAMNVLNTKVEKLRNENKNLIEENNQKDQLIGELKPKADYTDRILQCDDLIKANVIACDYGFSTIEFNKILNKFGIQYKQGKDWLLYKKYRGKGYTQTKTFEFIRLNGTQGSRTSMMWTQKGRLFLYEFLKVKGILPRMEEEQVSIY